MEKKKKLILKLAKYLNSIDDRNYDCWSRTTKSDQQYYLDKALEVLKIVQKED